MITCSCVIHNHVGVWFPQYSPSVFAQWITSSPWCVGRGLFDSQFVLHFRVSSSDSAVAKAGLFSDCMYYLFWWFFLQSMWIFPNDMYRWFFHEVWAPPSMRRCGHEEVCLFFRLLSNYVY